MLADQVYEQLRTAIVKGEYSPHERLVETDLADQLGVSRTPVREGLQRLASEGLVQSRRRAWFVHYHTPDEVREIYEIRAALEGYAARLAAERGSDSDLSRIQKIHEDHGVDTARGPRDHLVELNSAFHDAILAAAENGRLTALTQQSREYFFDHDIATLYSDEDARASIAGHARIVEALFARDPDRAEDAIRDHIFDALALLTARGR